ncbi:hypothetical protein ACQEU8_04080 [Streptomyces sp. CA-250714]|uniref:hypothetical protein n=1 Tax=Streptomyces sp. CA-250714 TaxID=3240060 RepID=UPI003D91D346
MPPQNEGSQSEPLTPEEVYERKRDLADQRMALRPAIEYAVQVLEWYQRETDPTATDQIAETGEAIKQLRDNWEFLEYLDKTRKTTPYNRTSVLRYYETYANSEPEIQGRVSLQLGSAISLANHYRPDEAGESYLAGAWKSFNAVAKEINAVHAREQEDSPSPSPIDSVSDQRNLVVTEPSFDEFTFDEQERLIAKYWEGKYRYEGRGRHHVLYARFLAETHGDYSQLRDKDKRYWEELKHGKKVHSNLPKKMQEEFNKDRGIATPSNTRPPRTESEKAEDAQIAQYWAAQNPPVRYRNRHVHSLLYGRYHGRVHGDWTKLTEKHMYWWHLDTRGEALPVGNVDPKIREDFQKALQGIPTDDRSSVDHRVQPGYGVGAPNPYTQQSAGAGPAYGGGAVPGYGAGPVPGYGGAGHFLPQAVSEAHAQYPATGSDPQQYRAQPPNPPRSGQGGQKRGR